MGGRSPGAPALQRADNAHRAYLRIPRKRLLETSTRGRTDRTAAVIGGATVAPTGAKPAPRRRDQTGRGVHQLHNRCRYRRKREWLHGGNRHQRKPRERVHGRRSAAQHSTTKTPPTTRTARTRESGASTGNMATGRVGTIKGDLPPDSRCHHDTGRTAEETHAHDWKDGSGPRASGLVGASQRRRGAPRGAGRRTHTCFMDARGAVSSSPPPGGYGACGAGRWTS